ncbi:C-factor-like [Frankliniella occidentalis]|uniref:C-factor-like n=1 Tax=Frankliniella occidentalis TaxID=133901 RepID=A0A9C6XT40_FRAOC|nr:C-factor-like [Frankliniella occidentalis]
MSSVFITGSNRGIGLEIVKQLLAHANPPAILFATCRNPDSATELQAIAKNHSNLKIIKFDVLDCESYEGVSNKVREIVGNKGLNVLINNAGVMLDRIDKLSSVNAQHMIDVYRTNTVAPILLIKALRPLLKQAAEVNKSSPMGWSRAAIINISSGLGSVSNNDSVSNSTFGGVYAYRESKAALNMASRSIAFELGPENILVLSLHPGWVQTDMGTSAADLKTEDSVRSMLNVMYNLKPANHDTFVQWEGKTLPW